MALGQDKNDDEGATEKFKKVNNAYNTLKNGGNGRTVGGDGEYDDESDDEYDDTPYEDFADFFEEFLGCFFMSRCGGPRGVFFPSGRGGPAFFAMGGAFSRREHAESVFRGGSTRRPRSARARRGRPRRCGWPRSGTGSARCRPR